MRGVLGRKKRQNADIRLVYIIVIVRFSAFVKVKRYMFSDLNYRKEIILQEYFGSIKDLKISFYVPRYCIAVLPGFRRHGPGHVIQK